MQNHDTPLSPFARLVLGFVAVNAFLGAGSLILFPGQTDSLFFWEISPPLNSALFGALYLSGAIATTRAVVRGVWEEARFLVPVLVTAGVLLLLTTWLHLDRFRPGFPLVYWLAVYLVAPVLAILIYIQHERRGASWQVARNPIRPATRLLALLAGAVVGLAGLVGLIRPDLVSPLVPWPMSALMVRVFSSWFTAFVPGLFWFALERDWQRLAPLANLLILSAVLNPLLILLHRQDLTPGSGSLGLFLAGIAGGGLISAAMHWIQRTPALSPAEMDPSANPRRAD